MPGEEDGQRDDGGPAAAASTVDELDDEKRPAPLNGWVVVLAPLLLAFVVVGPLAHYGAWPDWVSRTIAAAAGAALCYWHWRVKHWKPMLESHMRCTSPGIRDIEVAQLQHEAGDTAVDPSGVLQVQMLVLGVTRPAAFRQRVVERYDVGHRVLRQQMTLDVSIPAQLNVAEPAPDADQREILFPLLVPPKGQLVDNLCVADSDGARIPVLAYSEYLSTVARALRTLLLIAYNARTLPPEAQQAEASALRAVMRRDHEPVDSSAADLLRNLRVPRPGVARLAARLVEKLAGHYAVLVSVPYPSTGRFVLQYERTITPALKLRRCEKGKRLSWLRARLRVLLGARPVDISLTLEQAWASHSYHLLVDGGDGIYVGHQKAPDLATFFDRGMQLKNGAMKPYYRFRRRAGQSYAHFYCREFAEPAAGRPVPVIRFRFYEVPPGSTLRALVAAFSAALLVWIIGFVMSRQPELDSDAPAYLLAFPAVAAAWLGFDPPARRLLEGTLAGRLSLLCTSLLSLGASTLYLITKSKLPFFDGRNPTNLQVLGIGSLYWSLLTVLAVINVSAILFIHIVRFKEFMYFSSRVSDSPGHSENS
ncbi:hypothetical protein [Actinoplanes sp. NPDC049316]|uniref:hypothetical protein n=1 Tax=Actinoplanes sp. NPDC049316 TaxID=3154727 RepID=UPI00343DAF4A